MEILVHKEERIALFRCQRMAFVTTSLGVKKLPASLSGVADCVLLPSDELIERGIERKLRALVGCDSAYKIDSVNRTTEYTPKFLLVFGYCCDPGHSSVQTRLAHFAWIHDGENRLVLKSFERPSQNCITLYRAFR